MMVQIRTVRAKAVSSLRSRRRFASARQAATTVLDASQRWIRLVDGALAGVPRCCGSQIRAPRALMLPLCHCCNLAVMAYSMAHPLKTRL